MTFSRAGNRAAVGIAAIDEGTFDDGKWVAGRRLNGDENEQGVSWRFDPRQERIERFRCIGLSDRRKEKALPKSGLVAQAGCHGSPAIKSEYACRCWIVC